MIEVHRVGCRCPQCVAPPIRLQPNVTPHRKKHEGRPCPEGCTCKRHNPEHRPGCMCPRHRPRKPKPEKAPRIGRRAGRLPREDMCQCGHLQQRHDVFGCQTCSARVARGVEGAKPCRDFRSKAGVDTSTPPETFGKEVTKAGFIKHIGELATCTVCWTSVKLGAPNTLTSVISARAHRQLCNEHVRARQDRRRPEPGTAVG